MLQARAPTLSNTCYTLVWECGAYEGGTLLVLLAISEHMDKETFDGWIGIERLSRYSRLHPRSVRRVLRQLERDGVLITDPQRGRGNANGFRIDVDRLMELAFDHIEARGGKPSRSFLTALKKVGRDYADLAPGGDNKKGDNMSGFSACAAAKSDDGKGDNMSGFSNTEASPSGNRKGDNMSGFKRRRGRKKPDTGVHKTGLRSPQNRTPESPQPLEPLEPLRARAREAPSEGASAARDWEAERERLRAAFGDDTFNAWFEKLQLVGTDPPTISCPTRFVANWIQTHYADRLAQLLGRERVVLTVQDKRKAG